MMEVVGRVERVANGLVWVRATTRSGCGRCGEPGGCGAARITEVFGKKSSVFILANRIGAAVGDEVSLQVQEGAPLKAALLSYGLSILLLLLGGASAGLIYPGDLGVALGGLGGLMVALGVNRLLVRHSRWVSGLSVQMLARGMRCTQGGVQDK
ncbi:SoxR reducing system RseC family protein [Azoarcus indigens]|uniref:SoxR reducing system RseC family protein n=1 Tax=Azoarcus indigens TaxID=29545 RepID=UPI001FE2AC4B|nr:SoxR reducing system RseC family protein [Azoarcus indigens]